MKIFASFFFVASLAMAQTTGIQNYFGYNPFNQGVNLKQSVLYHLPDSSTFGPGPYPVFMWVPATFESYLDPLSLTFVQQMANRGFLAISVQYSNTNLAQNCNQYTSRAQAIFDATQANSAVAAVCSLDGADCDKGLVVAGMSQGAAIAILAKNYAPQVQAVYALSMGGYANYPDFACLAKQNTAIPANRLLLVNGGSDLVFGNQIAAQTASGVTCPNGSTQCWSADNSGAGWYLVQNSEVTDGSADHCYFDIGGCTDFFDPKWSTASTSMWSLGPSLDWLATLGTHR